MFGVYIIRNQKNGKIYIGSSKDCPRRIKNHMDALDRGDHINTALQQEWDKFGRAAFEFALVTEKLARRESIRLENELIQLHEACDPERGYNNMVNGRWSTAARLRNAERRFIAKRKYVLLPGISLNDPMKPEFLKSASKAIINQNHMG